MDERLAELNGNSRVRPSTSLERPEKRAPKGWLFGVDLLGMTFPTQLYGDYFISHEIRIPSLTIQDSMESRRVFFVAHL